MASIVLGVAGGFVGGPVGAILGGAIGSYIDRAILQHRSRHKPSPYDLSVMSLGGFLGRDNTTTVDHFADLVASGDVRYVLTSQGGPGGGGPGGGGGLNPRGGF